MKQFTLMLALSITAMPVGAQAQMATSSDIAVVFSILGAMAFVVTLVLWIVIKIKNAIKSQLSEPVGGSGNFRHYLADLDADEIDTLLKKKNSIGSIIRKSSERVLMITLGVLLSNSLLAQPASESQPSLFSQPGVIITLVLVFIPLFISILLLVFRAHRAILRFQHMRKEKEAALLADYLLHLEEAEIDASLLKRKSSLEYKLNNTELSGTGTAEDTKGIIQRVSNTHGSNFVPIKKRATKRPTIDPKLSNLILWYLGCAIFWLVFGTTVGEYLGIKFVSPDVDHVSWLSFGRLRPVHTNAVFWGWSSLAMLGLGHYVVSIVSNCPLASIKKGWASLVLINIAVILGTIFLMAGINNGGGEYREYIWPVMSLFGVALIITLLNFIQTVSQRKTNEIYISNWYIVSAVIFTIIIAFIAYWPTWQNGLGETIVQGYYMHQGVGMWFMLFTLGLVYYFLPQQLNKPIYSYSLGILAFWTQILFYTLIGTHHFVFSSIPWWLQTVAIVGSMGMLIPVIAGTTNFLLTFKGAWSKIASSYTLPFFLIGVVFYFTGSFQGTVEAFRFTNLVWHFTDFTVAHSHITMYGIIAFLLWGSIYALVPRMTGNEPAQVTVGIHFWLALVGMILYSIPLMIGGTLKGLLWMDGKPFMDGVVMMAPYWLWRAIGGSMMWLSHLFFAYNFYQMIVGSKEVNIKKLAFEKLRQEDATELHRSYIN
jgi:cytochrome c oxidase cbb3-type subunit 1